MKEILEVILIKEVILPIIYLTIAFIVYFLIKKVLRTAIFNRVRGSKATKKANTIESLINNILKYIIGFIAVAAVLSVYNINVTSLLAGAGIVGIVIGFSLQDILKDTLSGISIITENQYEVGDIIQIGTYKGEVISLGLKTTRIRNIEGDVKIIANRNITEIINYSLTPTYINMKLSIKSTKSIKEIEKMINKIILSISNIEHLKETPIIKIDNKITKETHNYVLKIITTSTKVEEVEQQILIQVKNTLDKENIDEYTLIGDSDGK